MNSCGVTMSVLFPMTGGGLKQARLDSSKKISDFFSSSCSSSPSPTKTRHAEAQTSLTGAALTVLEGKASKSERISILEQVSHCSGTFKISLFGLKNYCCGLLQDFRMHIIGGSTVVHFLLVIITLPPQQVAELERSLSGCQEKLAKTDKSLSKCLAMNKKLLLEKVRGHVLLGGGCGLAVLLLGSG